VSKYLRRAIHIIGIISQNRSVLDQLSSVGGELAELRSRLAIMQSCGPREGVLGQCAITGAGEAMCSREDNVTGADSNPLDCSIFSPCGVGGDSQSDIYQLNERRRYRHSAEEYSDSLINESSRHKPEQNASHTGRAGEARVIMSPYKLTPPRHEGVRALLYNGERCDELMDGPGLQRRSQSDSELSKLHGSPRQVSAVREEKTEFSHDWQAGEESEMREEDSLPNQRRNNTKQRNEKIHAHKVNSSMEMDYCSFITPLAVSTGRT